MPQMQAPLSDPYYGMIHEDTLEGSDTLLAQLHANWLRSDVTRHFQKLLSSQADELEKRARLLACNYHQNRNHQEIVQCLVKAEELRRVLDLWQKTPAAQK